MEVGDDGVQLKADACVGDDIKGEKDAMSYFCHTEPTINPPILPNTIE